MKINLNLEDVASMLQEKYPRCSEFTIIIANRNKIVSCTVSKDGQNFTVEDRK